MSMSMGMRESNCVRAMDATSREGGKARGARAAKPRASVGLDAAMRCPQKIEETVKISVVVGINFPMMLMGDLYLGPHNPLALDLRLP